MIYKLITLLISICLRWYRVFSRADREKEEKEERSWRELRLFAIENFHALLFLYTTIYRDVYNAIFLIYNYACYCQAVIFGYNVPLYLCLSADFV